MLKATFLDDDFTECDLVLLKLRLHDADIYAKRYCREKVNIIDLDFKFFDKSLEADKSPALQITISDNLLGDTLDNSSILHRVDGTDVLVCKNRGKLSASHDRQLW